MKFRESVRALLMDPDGHVLLVRFDWPGLDIDGGIWSTPGGGLEPGETPFAALRRELIEETGLNIDHLGPELWTRTAPWAAPGYDGQIDHIHLQPTERFDPHPQFSPAQLAAENIRDLRWWKPEQITHEAATFAPGSLPELLTQLHRDGVPERPISVHGL